jgi:tetratricopeptide (TPR) repeat protein
VTAAGPHRRGGRPAGERPCGPAQSNLAHAYHALGRLADAEEMARAAVATEEELLGPEHPSLGPSLHALGQIRRDRGDLDQADALLRRSLAIQEATADGRRHVPDLLEELAERAERRGRPDEAAAFRRRIDSLAAEPPPR